MSYHPSQCILPQYEPLYTKSILHSLLKEPTMLGNLPESATFSFTRPRATPLPPLQFNQKLGHLYEEAFAFLLQHDPQYKTLHQNYQLFTEKKQTLGEIDFLLWDLLNQTYIHLEIAVKFYLIHPSKEGYSYPGPDATDNYHRKLQRMRTHQLTLTQQPQVQHHLQTLSQGQTIHVQHRVQGILFDHVDAIETPQPSYLNPLCKRRTWLHCHQMKPSKQHYRIVPKPLWLCPISPEIFQTLIEVNQQELLSLSQQRCTMFLNTSRETPQFLVPDTWPKH